ncbi:Extracellular solute-binding protein [Pseudomonas savastanoi pv. glycinea]|nr:Extracellular solute-binding protein [Pseudomonas savastanoi pv. glycinea]RML88198.1 Extracellular solute-binding protein [Pseudomonas savastanoi pv. glycinea]
MTLREGVTYHDGEPFDAASVKFNLDRARTLPDSLRKSELASVDSVEVIDAKTVAIKLKQADATLVSQLSDRAGMMLAPKAAQGEFASNPVCSGPYKFVQRVQQDRIVLERLTSTGINRRITSTKWCSCRFRIPRCAWPTCAPAT